MVKRVFSLGVVSDTGEIRSSNQDHLLAKVGEDKSGEFGLFAVADGVGGMDAGHKASGLAIDTLEDWWSISLLTHIRDIASNGMDALENELDHVMRAINKRIFSSGKSTRLKLGTTLTVLFVYRNQFLLRHVGDTRAYLLNARLQQLTEDHSIMHHAYKNILTRCMGISESVEVDKVRGTLQADDRLLLCSDGFYAQLQNYEMVKALSKTCCIESSLQKNVEALAMLIRQRKAPDNFSAIAIGQNWQNCKEGGRLHMLKALIGL